MEARVCTTRAAKLVNAVSRAIGAASRRQPMEALSDQALARERHWSAPRVSGGAAGRLRRVDWKEEFGRWARVARRCPAPDERVVWILCE